DSNVQAVGAWEGSSATNTYSNVNTSAFFGSNYFRLAAGGVGDNYFRWKLDPVLKVDGKYKVYARWTKSETRSTNAEYTVTHDGGSSTFVVNQQENGGDWNFLGAFDFSAGADQAIQIADIGDDTYVIADSVRLVRDLDWQDGDEIIVDNDAATLTGSWLTGNSSLGQLSHGPDYLRKNTTDNTPKVSASWEPTFARSGRYQVYVKGPYNWRAVRNTYYTVHHADGVTKVLADQLKIAGGWLPLGSFNMDVGSNHRVVLTEKSEEHRHWYMQFAYADAVKFVRDGYIRPETEVPPIIVDNADTNTSSTGAWNSYSNSRVTYWGPTFHKHTSLSTPSTFT
ncbi:MAG: hypothetical protein V7727_22375, partial [Sneathiella sp.]